VNNDAKIIKDIIQNGRRTEYGELVEKYSNFVFSTCLSILGNREDAADIAQEAFVKAYEILGDLRDPSKYALWLKRIAAGMSKNLLRANSRQKAHVQTFAESGSDIDMIDTAEAIGKASKREQTEIVREHIAALPERYRTVIILKYLEGLKYRDIAAFLELSERTVKAASYEAKKLLLKRLKKQGVLDASLLQSA